MRILELFAGIGACSKALERIGIDLEIVDAVEIDKYAIASFNAIHNTNFEVQDITTYNKIFKDIDLITHGSPCFLKGEKVNTKDGFRNIEDIKIGDYVKSHNGNYNKVVKTFRSRNDKIVDIQASAIHNINTTENHPFLVKRNDKVGWLQVKELTTKDFFCIPINKKNEDINYTSNLPLKSIRFWYLIGRFIGDGWLTRRKERNNNISGIKICCAKNELKDLEYKLCNILHYCVVEDKTTYKIQFSNKELGEFCSQFGIGAKNKHIPQWVLDLKKEYLEYLLMGIIDSDGCFSQNKYKVTTISRDLAYNIGELVLKVKNVPYHLYKTIRPPKYKIENREVNQNNTYQITWSNIYNKNINFLDDNFLYSRVRKIKKRTEVNTVYNIEVENTHSYCVNNVATHNCQDFSVAGKQAGGDIGSGTRSSLMYETIRIVGQIRPKYVLWENVKNILSKKHKHNFDSYIEAMSILGYNSYYQVLNAKDYGIPQNRERVYTISIRKDIDTQKIIYDDYNSNIRKDQDTIGTLTTNCGSSATRNGWKIIEKSKSFKFPPKEQLKLRLKDMLEDEVDEKYYLSDTQIERIKTTTYNVGKTRIQEKEYCDTLCARDWKDPKCVRIGGIFDTENHGTVTAVAMRGRYNEVGKVEQQIEVSNREIANSITTVQKDSMVGEEKLLVKNAKNPLRIRKLTPKECWRLMGFDDEDFEKAANVPTSNTQLYKQARKFNLRTSFRKDFLSIIFKIKEKNMSKRMLPNDEKLIELYIKQKKSCKEICRIYELSENSSSNLGIRLKKLGVEIRKDAGINHHNWKGGRIIKGDGYVGIWKPNHKKSDNQGYVYEHTLIVENQIKRQLNKDEEIHHINLDKTDNNIDNLCLCTHKTHIKIHRSIEKLIPRLLKQNIIYFDRENKEYRTSRK